MVKSILMAIAAVAGGVCVAGPLDRAVLHGDYCCPPSGVAILYNNLRCPKKINWVQGSTHGYVPSEAHQKFSLSYDWE